MLTTETTALITTTVRRGSKEWRRMWRELERCWGATSQPSADGLEDWQYLGTSGGRHEFRHRNHPKHGRTVWTLQADHSLCPSASPAR